MQLGKLEHKLGTWQFMFRAMRREYHRFGFHPWMDLWIVKFKTFPQPGELIAPKHYTGINWKLRLPLPYIDQRYQSSIAHLIKWDVKPIPQWVPRWVLMSDWRDPVSRMPRPLLIKFLNKRFALPTKIKFE